MYRGRLAPSPTGALHLGHVRTYLVAWLRARQHGGSLVMRIEDLDAPRVVEGSAKAICDDLEWLGLDWDEGPFWQSQRTDRYEAALARLTDAGLVYPCSCSRKEIALASAPHGAEELGPRYPGTCRNGPKHPDRPCSLRFRASPDGERSEPDLERSERSRGGPARASATRGVRGVPPRRGGLAGGEAPPNSIDSRGGPARASATGGVRGVSPRRGGLAGGEAPPNSIDDFVVRRADGVWSYQLAVVVDDAEMGITEVVRGDDLLPSTPRQIALHRALGFEPPRFLHVPLVLGPDGTRLSKRHGAAAVSALREHRTPEEIIGLVAGTLGMSDRPARPHDLVERFDAGRLPSNPYVFDKE